MSSHSRARAAYVKVLSSLRRDRDLPFAYKFVKGLRYLSTTLLAPVLLVGCDRIGKRVRARGRPIVANAGVIEIGDDTNIVSRFSAVQLITAAGARLEIARNVTINFGTRI